MGVRLSGSQPTAVLDSLAQLRNPASRVAERISTKLQYWMEKAYRDKRALQFLLGMSTDPMSMTSLND